jgi:hypothetical protein
VTSRKPWHPVALTAGLALMFASLATPRYLLVGDPEHYVELARAIAQGEPYAVNTRPEVRFPPGFPLLLAPAARTFKGSFTAINRWAAILASLALPLTFLWARRREPRFAWPITIATIGSVSFLDLATGNPLSEPVFLATTMGLLLWVEENERSDKVRRGWSWILLGCLLFAGLPAIRTAGIAAVAAFGIHLLVRKRKGEELAVRDFLPLAAGVAFIAGWFLWSQTQGVAWYTGGGEGGYLGKLLRQDPHNSDIGGVSGLQLLGRAGQNLAVQAAHLGELFTPAPWVNPSWFSPLLLALPLILAGWWQDLRAKERFTALYFACYMGIVLLWPYDEGPRFLLVVAPLIWVYLLEGLRQLSTRIGEDQRWLRSLGCLVSATAAVALMVAWRRSPTAFSRQDQAALAIWCSLFAVLALGWNRLVRLSRQSGTRQATALVVIAVALAVIGSIIRMGPYMVQRARGAPPVDENPRSLWEASNWIVANTPAEAVIQTTYATRVHFATGRPTVPFPSTTRPAPFMEIERRHHPAFLIVLDSDDPYVLPTDKTRFKLVEALFPGRWTRVGHFLGGSIYAFH